MKLSIIIPVYNGQKYLKTTVDSILGQSLTDYEIILVNDGSTDNSFEICNQLSDAHNHIKVFSKENEGVSVARNYGVEKAEGEWITFVDADDGVIDNSLDNIDDYLLSDVDLVLFKYSSSLDAAYTDSGEKHSISPSLLRKCVFDYATQYANLRAQGYYVDNYNNWACWGKLYRKSLIIDNNVRFPQGITHGEDLAFIYAYYSFAKNIIAVDKTVYFYRTDNVSVTRRFNPKRLINTEKLYEAMYALININKEDLNAYYIFVLNRLFACCYLYFADRGNNDSLVDRTSELKQFCDNEYIKSAFEYFDGIKRFSTGAKTNIFMKLVLEALKKERFSTAIFISGIYNKV